MSVSIATTESFKKEVLESELPVIVDFFADWCGPCKITAPIFEELAEELQNKLKFVKVNVDENQDLAQEYNIMSIPTFLIFKNGKKVAEFIGARDKNGFLEEINKVI
ncbi:MAG: thioredoxin [Patescibacteria group bacterium]|nr:MAG: thioredoxin [Patescibacteria group bacterium]